MMGRERDWDELRAQWLAAGDAETAIAAARRQMAHAQRQDRLTRLIELAVAGGALLLVVLALVHAANPFERLLGAVVGAAIPVVWFVRRAEVRNEQLAVESSNAEYVARLRGIRARQARLAPFIWVILALDLTFLIPWWVIGSRVHSRRLTDTGSLVTMWLPLLGMALLFSWSVRMRRRVRQESAGIDRLQEEQRRDTSL